MVTKNRDQKDTIETYLSALGQISCSSRTKTVQLLNTGEYRKITFQDVPNPLIKNKLIKHQEKG